MPAERPPPAGDGAIASVRALGATFLALLGARAELVGIELKEEAQKRKQLLTLLLFAALFLACALLLAAVFVVVLFWETHRLEAIAAVTIVYAAIGSWSLLRFRAILRDSPPAFSATLAEFRKDIEMIQGSDEPR